MISRRSFPALALALAVLGSPLAAGTAEAASTGVTWSIDHVNKEIKADVKLTLKPVCSTSARMVNAMLGGAGGYCQVPQKAADDIRKAIEAIWNKDNRYYCYDIVVKVDIKIDNNPTSGDPSDRLRVDIDQSPVPVRSFVWATGGGPPSGNTPAHQVQAINGGTKTSTWGYPPRTPQTYAHETGHILGLDDGYDANGNTVPGHAEDMMANNIKYKHLDKSTIRRMVERQGYKKTDLKCNYKIDRQVGPSKVTGLQCDPEGGIWTANGVYQIAGAVGDQAWTLVIDWDTKRGRFDYADNQEADFGIGNIKVITEGEAAGRVMVTIDGELNAVMTLTEQAHSFRAQIPGTPAFGNDQNAPLQTSTMIWEPIGRCPPP